MSNDSAAPVPESPVQTEDAANEVFDIESITRQASTTIVLHPGSSHLRIGRASDPQPILIPHVIAWRHKHPGSQKPVRKSLLSREPEEYDPKQNAIRAEGLKESDNAVCAYTGRPSCKWEQVAKSNKKMKSETFPEGCGWNWTDTSKEQEFLIGDDALYMDEKDCYDLNWPIVKGQLNVQGGHRSLATVLNDIEVLWTSAIETFLRIPRKELKDYRICLDVGGRDITSIFAHLLKRNCFPYQKFDPDDRMDALLLEELKETFCHMESDRVSPESQEFHIRRPGQSSLLYPIMLGDETLQATFSLFFPKVFGLKMSGGHIHFMSRNPGDPEDPLDEYFLQQTRSKQEVTKEARASKREKAEKAVTATLLLDDTIEKMDDDNGEDLEDDEGVSSQSCIIKMTTDAPPPPTGLVGLDQAIVWSVENCPLSYEDEVKRRMYACVLVVGGGLAHFEGAEKFLVRRIKAAIPATPLQALMVSQVDVVVRPKDQDPSIVAWKGGSVLSCLDNAQECWVTNKEWKKYGLKLLRERSPFVW